MTQRIEPFFFFFTWLKELNFFFEYDRRELNLFFERIEPLFEYDSKNWTLFSLSMTSRIWTSFFLNMTQRIEPFFWCDQRKLKIRTFIFWMTPRIEPIFFKKWLNELNLFRFDSKIWFYSVCPKELNFLNRTDRIGPFFLNMTQRIEPFFL